MRLNTQAYEREKIYIARRAAIPVSCIRLMKKKVWLGLKLLRRNMKGQVRLQILKNL